MTLATTQWLTLGKASVAVNQVESFLCRGATDGPAEATHCTAAPAPGRKGEQLPAAVGKYLVKRLLGRGGQATALLAWDPDLQREVVLKLYHAAKSPAERAAVLREGQALVQVQSPFVAQCYAAERHHEATPLEVPYLVMEHIQGESLAERLRDRRLSLEESLRLMERLARGLEAVHQSGLLHRDLKPSNILLAVDGQPKLIDFGLAAAVGSEQLRQISGTPAYMAPEQACGDVERLDARTDIFGLGAVFYELLTGRPPYLGENTTTVWRLAREGRVTPAVARTTGLRSDVNEVCMRCLSRDPQARYASAEELADALNELLHGKRRDWNWTIGWGKWRIRLAAGVSVLACVAATFLALPNAAFRQKDGPSEVGRELAWDALAKNGPATRRPAMPAPAVPASAMAGPNQSQDVLDVPFAAHSALAEPHESPLFEELFQQRTSKRWAWEGSSTMRRGGAAAATLDGAVVLEGAVAGLEVANVQMSQGIEGGVDQLELELVAPQPLEIWEDREEGVFVPCQQGWAWSELTPQGGRSHYWLAAEPSISGYWIWPGGSTEPEKRGAGSESCRLRIRNLAKRPGCPP